MKFLGLNSNYKKAKIIVFGAPFDGTTSYKPGTRFAYKRMIEESEQIETYSLYQDKDLCDYFVHDFGNLELPFGNTKKALKIIEKKCDLFFSDKKCPIMIGGEHLVTLPVIKSAIKKYKKINIIHFDAHTDLRDEYLGEKLSHATVIRRIFELENINKIYQFGIRSGTREEFLWAKNNTFLNKFNFDGLDIAIKESLNIPTYLTIDLDVLDPAYFGATGTSEAGGVNFIELLNAIKSVILNLKIIGADMVELCPMLDFSGNSTLLACKLLRELILYICKKNK